MHCGLMARDEWIGEEAMGLAESIGGRVQELPVRALGICPGTLVRADAVVEAYRARQALAERVLEVAFPEPSNPLLEGALAASHALNLHQVEQMRADAAKRRRE